MNCFRVIAAGTMDDEDIAAFIPTDDDPHMGVIRIEYQMLPASLGTESRFRILGLSIAGRILISFIVPPVKYPWDKF